LQQIAGEIAYNLAPAGPRTGFGAACWQFFVSQFARDNFVFIGTAPVTQTSRVRKQRSYQTEVEAILGSMTERKSSSSNVQPVTSTHPPSTSVVLVEGL
jgi:hypothetical protein